MKITKDEIIQKAFGLFLSHSYKDVTLSLILKETGLSKGGFYHHFASKEELFESVVEMFFFGVASDKGFQPRKENTFVENMDMFLDQKENAFRLFAQNFGIEQSEINFFMFIMQAIQYLPGVRQKVDLFMYQEKQQLERIIAMAKQKGELKETIETRHLAEILMKLFDGTEMHGVLLSQSFETHKKEREMVRQIYEWVRIRD